MLNHSKPLQKNLVMNVIIYHFFTKQITDILMIIPRAKPRPIPTRWKYNHLFLHLRFF